MGVDVTGAAEGQAGENIEAHAGPEPRRFAPDEGIGIGLERGGKGGASERCGIGYDITFGFVEAEAQFEAGRRNRLGTCALGEPRFDRGGGILPELVEARFEGGAFGEGGVDGGQGGVGGDAQDRERCLDVEIPGFVGGVVEKRGELEMVFLRDGIELVVVAGGATGGEAEEGGPEGLDAVAGEVHRHFFGDGAAFVGGDAAAHEAGGGEFVDVLGGKEVAGELFADEAVERFVGVEGADDVIAVRPDRAVVVEMQAVGVAVASVVEPVTRPVFAVARAGEEAVNGAFVGIGCGVG